MVSIQILDGGLGTSLGDSYGITFDHSKPLWSGHLLVEGEDTLLACQKDFVDAGADVILTATYQAFIDGFQRTKTSQYPDGIPKSAIGPYLQKAVDIVEKAIASGNAKIALSLGPYGASLGDGEEFSGKYDTAHASEESLYEWHMERLQLFTAVNGLTQRVSYVAMETVPRLDELRAVRRAIKDSGITAPFWLSSPYPGDEDKLPDGSAVDEVVKGMILPTPGAADPWGIGINCTALHKLPSLIEAYEKSIADLLAAGSIKSAPTLLLYPDGTQGEVYNATSKQFELPEGQQRPRAYSVRRITTYTLLQDRG